MRGRQHRERRVERAQHGLDAAPAVRKPRSGHAVREIQHEHHFQIDVLCGVYEEARLRVVDLLPAVRAGADLVHFEVALDLTGRQDDRPPILISERKHDLDLARRVRTGNHPGEVDFRDWGRGWSRGDDGREGRGDRRRRRWSRNRRVRGRHSRRRGTCRSRSSGRYGRVRRPGSSGRYGRVHRSRSSGRYRRVRRSRSSGRYGRVRRPRSSSRYRRVRSPRSSGRYGRVRRHGRGRWLGFGGCLNARGYACLDSGLGVDSRGARRLNRGFCIDLWSTLPARNKRSRYERPNTDDDANHEPTSPSCTLCSTFYHPRRLDMSCAQPAQSAPMPLLLPARGFTSSNGDSSCSYPAAAQAPTELP